MFGGADGPASLGGLVEPRLGLPDAGRRTVDQLEGRLLVVRADIMHGRCRVVAGDACLGSTSGNGVQDAQQIRKGAVPLE